MTKEKDLIYEQLKKDLGVTTKLEERLLLEIWEEYICNCNYTDSMMPGHIFSMNGSWKIQGKGETKEEALKNYKNIIAKYIIEECKVN